MKDLAFQLGDLYVNPKDGDLVLAEKSEALVQELFVFLNIRAAHLDDSGNILIPGELEFDQLQGIDFTYVLDRNTAIGQIKNHYRTKILTYYGDYITQLSRLDITRDVNTRELTIEFDYKTIWSTEKQTFKLGGKDGGHI